MPLSAAGFVTYSSPPPITLRRHAITPAIEQRRHGLDDSPSWAMPRHYYADTSWDGITPRALLIPPPRNNITLHAIVTDYAGSPPAIRHYAGTAFRHRHIRKILELRISVMPYSIPRAWPRHWIGYAEIALSAFSTVAITPPDYRHSHH
jgi:hypothetical protein